MKALQDDVAALQREVAMLKQLLGLNCDPLSSGARLRLKCDRIELGSDTNAYAIVLGADEIGARIELRDGTGRERLHFDVSAHGPKVTLRGEDGEPRVALWEEHNEATVAVFAPGGKPRAGLKGLVTGGLINVVNDAGEAEVAMVGRAHGGELFVLNKGRSTSVRLAAFEDSAVVSAQRGDQPVTTMAATRHGGSFVVLGDSNEVAAVMASGEEGGHVRVFDSKGVSRAGILVRKDVASISVENALGNEVCALSSYKGHGHLDLRTESGRLGVALDAAKDSSISVYNESDQTTALISSSDNGGVMAVNDNQGRIAAVIDVEGSHDKLCGRVGVAAPGQAIRALLTTNGSEGVVAVLNENGETRGTMIGLTDGGTFHSYGSENTVLAVLGGTTEGGALTVNNDLGICRAALCVHKDGGQVQLYWAGSPVATLSAQEASGMLYLFDSEGELRTQLPEDEPG